MSLAGYEHTLLIANKTITETSMREKISGEKELLNCIDMRLIGIGDLAKE